MSGFHNEHIVGDYQMICDNDKCQVIGAICEICHEDISWIINRRDNDRV